jgi:hypothetical protein
MAKYLSGRSKRTPQSALSDERYRYLSVGDAEPNFGDPIFPGDFPPFGQQYQIVSVEGYPGERYWVPIGGGVIPGSISVFDEGNLVGGSNSTTEINFVGAAITVIGISGPPPGTGVTVTVFAPGNNSEILFNTFNDFSTSPKLKFDNSTGSLIAGDRIIVGVGGTVITTTGVGSVGIGTINPTQELHLHGDFRITGTIYDYLNSPGSPTQLIAKNNFGGITWVDQGTVRSAAGGTVGNVQYHNSVGLVDGASNFVFDEFNNRIGIGSTIPTVLFDVLGYSKFTGQTQIDNLNVTGIATLKNLGVSGLTTTRDLQVYESTLLNRLKVSGISTFDSQVIINNLNVTGVGTFDNIKLDTNTVSTNVGNLIIDSSGGTTQINDIVYINDYTQSINSNTGALVVEGGVGIGSQLNVDGAVKLATLGGITTTGGDLYVAGNLYVNNDIFYDELFVRNGYFTGIVSTKDLLVTGVATIATLGVSGLTTTRTLRVTGISTFDDFIDANGGAYIDNIQIGITDNNEIDTSSGNLTIDSAGGLTTIDDRLFVTGISTFNANTVFNANVTLGNNVGGDTVSFGSSVNTNIIPQSTDTYDLGQSDSLRWRTIYAQTFSGKFIGNADTASQIATATTTGISSYFLTFVDSNNSPASYETLYTDSGITYTPSNDLLTVGKLVVTGISTFENTSTFNGITTFTNNVFIGNSNTDKVSFAATVDSNIIPSGIRDLGSITNRWDKFYVNEIVGTVTGTISSVSITNDSSTNAIRFISFASTVSGSSSIYGDTNLTFNPSNDTVSIGGSLGIGNANPGTRLDVTGNVRLSGSVPEIELNTGGPRFRVPSSNTLTVHTGGGLSSGTNEVIRINATGVGIETSTPRYKLHVIGDTNITGLTSLGGNLVPTGNGTQDIGLPDRKWNKFYVNELVGTITGTISSVSITNDTSTAGNPIRFISFASTFSGSSSVYGDSLLTFNPTSNSLGIGVANPTAPLDVAGRVFLRRNDTLFEGGEIAFARAVDDAFTYAIDVYGNTAENARLRFIDVQSNAERATIDRSGNFIVGSGSSTGTASQPLQVTGGAYVSGNIGIGVLNPSEKLQVAGNVAPDQNGTRDLGTPSLKWNKIYTNELVGTITGTISSVSITNDSSTNAIRFINFASTVSGSSSIYGDDLLVWNPNTNSLGIGTTNPSIPFGNVGVHINNAGLNIQSVAPIIFLQEIDNSNNYYNLVVDGGIFGVRYNNNFPGPLQVNSSSVLIGSATSTGTASQPLQVTGGAYVSDNVGIGVTNPSEKLQVAGNVAPDQNGTRDLGTSILKWNTVYANTFNGQFIGNADTASKLATPRIIAATDDISWSVSFDGSSNVSSAATLSNTGVIAGTYGSSTQVGVVTVDAKGRITSASNVSIAFTNATVARAGYADSAGIATNLRGGTAYQIPYQSAVNTTAFIANGTVTGQLLQYNSSAAPSWVNPSGLTVSRAGYADTAGIATNLRGGSPGSIPYQSSSNVTTFLNDPNVNGAILTWNDSSSQPSWTSATNFTAGFASYATKAGLATDVELNGSGQLLYQPGNNNTELLSFGSAGQILQSNGTGAAPSWVNLSGLTAGFASYATKAGLATDVELNGSGQLLYQPGNNNTELLSFGSAGQILRSNGTGAAPSWITLGSSVGAAISGLTIRDEGTITPSGGVGVITTINFVGSGITVVGSSSGIATVTFLGDQILEGTIKSTDTTTQTSLYPVMVSTVGVATTAWTSSTKLSFNAVTGQINAVDFNSTSDQTLKTNIKPILSPLEKVSQINGVTFNWIEGNIPSIGVIAQQVEKVFPELVTTTSEYKSVRYNGLIGLLIEAIKEQQMQIEDLKLQLEDLKSNT